MATIGKKILSFIFAVLMLFSSTGGLGYYAAAGKIPISIRKELTASDGKVWEITVTYDVDVYEDGTADFPENAELRVVELTAREPEEDAVPDAPAATEPALEEPEATAPAATEPEATESEDESLTVEDADEIEETEDLSDAFDAPEDGEETTADTVPEGAGEDASADAAASEEDEYVSESADTGSEEGSAEPEIVAEEDTENTVDAGEPAEVSGAGNGETDTADVAEEENADTAAEAEETEETAAEAAEEIASESAEPETGSEEPAATESDTEKAIEEVSEDAGETVSGETAPAVPAADGDTVPETEDADDPAEEFEFTYDEYVEKAAEALEREAEEFKTVRVFDISLVDPATGEELEPNGTVNVSIKLLEDEIEESEEIRVVHFGEKYDEEHTTEEESKPEVLEATLNDDTVEFKTDGFSVYVVVSHEGGETVENPRVEFHYIDPDYTETNPGEYSASPYHFVNKGGTYQVTQIVKDGETLEMIANPPNKKDTNGNEASYFYGWYTVSLIEDTTAWNGSAWNGTITYTWPDPKKVDDEIPMTLTPDPNNGSGGYKVGDTVTWQIGEASGTAVLDENGTAHVYLVPMYADFYFVNFHMGNKEADAGLRNNLMTRRLVVFGTRDAATVHIGDVECPSPDPAHQIFAGWETVENNGGSLESDVFYATVDIDGNEVTKTVDVDGNEMASAGTGYYITIAKNGSEASSIDLYPVFAEARWVNFTVGVSGNGATYVPSAYRLTNDDGMGTAFETFPTSTRPGYDFSGWYLNAAMPENNILNLDGEYDLSVLKEVNGVQTTVTTHYTQAIQLTDGSGNIVDAVKGKVFWINDPDTESLTCGDAVPDGKEKLFEVTADGKLFTYKPLDSITLAAKWDPKVVDYTVVYWLQNANDDNYTLVEYDKELHAIAGETVRITTSGNNGRTININADSDHDYTFALQNTNENGGHYVKDLRFIHYKTYDGIDGNVNKGIEIAGNNSTVINVYYDRDVYRLRFDIGFARRTSTTGSTPIWSTLSAADAASYSGTVYGIVDGSRVELTRATGGYTYSYSPSYTESTAQNPTMYGIVNGQYVQLDSTPVNGYSYSYTQYDTTEDNEGTQYALVDGEYVPLTYEVVDSTTVWTVQYTYTKVDNNNNNGTQYGIYNDEFVQLYYGRNSRWDSYAWWRTRSGNSYSNQYTENRYTRSNGGTYTGTRYTTPTGNTVHTGNTGTSYGRNGTTIYQLTPTTSDVYAWTLNGTVYNGDRYKQTTSTDYTGQRYTKSGSVYTSTDEDAASGQWGVDSRGGHVALTGTSTVVGYTFTANGASYTGTRYTRSADPTKYTGTRYSDADCTVSTTSDEGTQYGKDANGVIRTLSRDPVYKWTYTDADNAVQTYTGTLYVQTNLSGTWQFSVSNTTNPNNGANDNWDTFLTQRRYDLGTTNPFGPEEYTGTYEITQSGTLYRVFYYDIVGKYGENILSKYPGSQPMRNNSYNFVGWLPQRDSFYTARLCTSIKGFFETISEDLILTGGTIPNYNTKNANADPNDYTAITVDGNNGYLENLNFPEHEGVTQEFRCRYRGSSGYNYLYRVYLADVDTLEYPAEPTNKFIITAGEGSYPNLQTPPTYTGYTLVSAKVIDKNGIAQEPSGNSGSGTYSAYSVSELTAAGISAGMIMEFRLQPNQWQIDYSYGKGSKTNLIGTSFGDEKVKYFGQSLSDANIYEDDAIANTPEGHTFDGWYENPDGIGNKFDFNSTMPDGDIILYAVYSPVQFRVRINPNGAEIDHIDHTGASYTKYPTPPVPLNRGEITYIDKEGNTVVERHADSGYVRSQSTYFNADFGEKVGEYAVSRSYVPISETASAPYIAEGRRVYAYVNLQNVGEAIDGQWGVPTALRDALYVDATYGLGQYKNNDPSQGETEIYQLYKFYHDLLEQEYAVNPPGWWDCDGAKELSFEAWKSRFAEKNAENEIQLYRKCNEKENWVFLGWYKDGDPMPYNFNDPVAGEITLTARWRLDGGYRIQYTPEFYMENGDWINGQMDAWVDPQEGSSQLTYTDGAYTTIFKQPTNLTRNGADVVDNSLIFRGWRVVSVRNTYADDGVTILTTEYIPLEDGVFYDPNDDYTIDVQYADSSNIIHMQAVYEDTASSYRRPHVTNLTLDANTGYLTAGSTPDNTVTEELAADTNLSWSSVGTISMDAGADQILFGDIQSSAEVHLYQYATTLTHVDGVDTKPALDPEGTNYFTHPNGYFLLGFDDSANEGDFVATYPADAIIAVTRNDDKTIYAVWEPMVYITLKNETEVGPVTFSLSSTSSEALQIINTANGMYTRTPMADIGSITIGVGESVRIAVPYGAGKDLTISGTNTLGIGYLLSAESVLGSDTNDPKTVRASFDKVKNTEDFGLTDTLVVDETGLVVTFKAEKNPHTLVLDDNYTGGDQQEIYFSRSTTDTVYFNDESVTSYKLPTTSTRVGYEFVGWDPDPDWIDNHNVETDSPAYNVNDWTIDDLTAFFTSAGSPSPDLDVVTLYAVWKVNVEATKVYVYKNVPAPGNQDKPFQFTVSLGGKYTYSTRTGASAPWVTSGEQSIQTMITAPITLKHGQYLKVTTTKHDGNDTTKSYLKSEIRKYDADGTEVGSPSVLNWEWNDWDPVNSNKKSNVSFTETNMSVTEKDYTADYYDTDLEITGEVTQSSLTKADGRTLTWDNTDAGGTVVVTNTRQTAKITVKKDLESNTNVASQFNFKAGYTLTEDVNGSPVTTNKDFGSFTVLSGSAGHDLEEIPVGAVLTVTEFGTDLCDYTTTAKFGTADLTVTETSEGSPKVYSRAVECDVLADNTVTYKNILKSYPVKFVKVDQDDVAGRIEAFFSLSASDHTLGTDLYARPGNGDVFYVSGGANEPFYAGHTYTLRETWVQDGFEGIDGAVTIKVSGEEGSEFTVSDTEHISVSLKGGVWEFRVKNQEVKDISIVKKLSDPLITQRTFTFNYSYSFNGTPVTGTFNMSTVAGSQATKKITVPVGATGFTVSEDTTKMANETDTIAETYDTTVKYKTGAEQTASSYTVGDITSASDDEVVMFSNVRKTVDITVKKIVKAENTAGEFALNFTVRHGEIPIKGYTVYGTATADPSDDLVTNNSGVVTPGFSLAHNEERTISIPVGASVLVKEDLTAAQAEKYAAFMTMPGVDLKLKNGKADEVELIGPTTDKELRIYNIPSICKVTDNAQNLLWFQIEGEGTPETTDDVYIPAIYDTIHGAFDDIGSYYKKTESGYKLYADPAHPDQNPYQIQMLVDYEVPNTDVVVVPSGYDMTFTTASLTASDGYPFRRTGEYTGASASELPTDESIGRAVLTRAAGSTKAFFTVSSGNATDDTMFRMTNLIIDGNGATLESNVKGGCLTAYNSDVTIDNCVIFRFEADEGGAVYTTGDSLTVTDSVFDTCKSDLGGDGNGGGAINTRADTLTITDSTFRNCVGVHQAGAVFQLGVDRTMNLTDCSFIDCSARSAGAVEADVTYVNVTGCNFIRCIAQATDAGNGGNGGGLNNFYNSISNAGSIMNVTDCTFRGCEGKLSPENKGTAYGGGVRSEAMTTILTNCVFEDDVDSTDPSNPVTTHCKAKYGGGAAFTNKNGTVEINGCTFTNCTATTGGAVYTEASAVTVQKNGTTETSVAGCSATSGGGIYTKSNTTVTDGTIIRTCTATSGGGIYLDGTAQAELTGSAILERCTATNGGGAYVKSGTKLTMSGSAVIDGRGSGSAIKNATTSGGGVYVAGTFEMAENCNAVIRNCTADVTGGAIFTTGSGARVNVKGGTISNNMANGYGGGAIRVEGDAQVTVSGTAEITGNYITGGKEKCGGAIGIKQGEVWIKGGTISGNYATGSGSGVNNLVQGGAIFVDGRSTAILHVEGGTITGNYVSATDSGGFAYGGAINVKSGGVLYLSGGTISGNYAKNTSTPANAKGAGIYLAQGSTLNISGNPSFGGADADDEGGFTAGAGNLLTTTLPAGSKNGGKDYEYARQDIYIAGYNGVTAASVNVTGTISSGKGAIWVWAEQDPHYIKDEQFALTVASGVNDASFAAFRNARVDGETLATTSPLYGVRSPDVNTHVIWGTVGDAVVTFFKYDGDGNVLAGAGFSVYSDSACTTLVNVTDESGASVDIVYSQDDSGTNVEGQVMFSLPVGIYYMKEVVKPGTEYLTNDNVYIVLAGNGVAMVPAIRSGEWTTGGVLEDIVQTDIDVQRGQSSGSGYDRDSAIFLINSGKATAVPSIAEYGIVNYKEATRKAILRKVTGDYEPLKEAEGKLATFDILRIDMTVIASGKYPADTNGIFWIGDLPLGTYYLHETEVPGGYEALGANNDNWFTITVSAAGVTVSSAGANP